MKREPSRRCRGAGPGALVAAAPILVLLAGCGSSDSADTCSPPCDPSYQVCRRGACADVCPGPCPAPTTCDFDRGICDYPRTDATDARDDGAGCADRDEDTIADHHEGESDPDGDTFANADDPDSDGDTIGDEDESGDADCTTAPFDSDDDTVPDFLDPDSDDDGYPDAEEAGDDRIETRPRDTDSWGVPDCRDTDSDNDGLSDAQERALGTNRISADTDGDTWTDFEEWGAPPADPLDPDIRPDPDAIIERVPYNSTSVYRTYTVVVEFKAFDVALALGCSAGAEAALHDLSARFAAQVGPGIAAVLPTAHFGAAMFGDGETLIAKTGTPLARLVAQTAETPAWIAAMELLPSCADGESAALTGEALAELADGLTPAGVPAPPPCPAGSAGLTCLRRGALPIVALVTSGVMPGPHVAPPPGGARSLDAAAAALRSRDGRVVPVLVGNDDGAERDMADLALAFGAVGPAGAPIWVRATGGGTAGGAAVLEAVAILARNMTQDVEMVAIDLPDDPPPADPANEIDAAQFAYYIDAYRYAPAPGFGREESVGRISGNTFFATVRGTTLAYRVYYRNGSLEHGPEGLRLHARLVVRTTRGTEIWSRTATFLVPCRAGDVDDGR